MNALKKLVKFNTAANTWLADLENKSAEEILMNSSQGSWSLSELYDHIIRVGRSYQTPNLKKSITAEADKKNLKGIIIFNVEIEKLPVKVKMEHFPDPLPKYFTSIKQNKSDLIQDFKLYIEEVNTLKEIVLKSSRKNKQYHPMFGDINRI